MELTPTQKKRLAREARKLAMECVNNGPEMDNIWCGCAIGLSLKRAKLWPGGPGNSSEGCDRASHLDTAFSRCSDGFILSGATRERIYRDNPTAVVIPLLAWADELEEEAAAASGKPRAAASKDGAA